MRARYLIAGIVAAAIVAGGLFLVLRHDSAQPDSDASLASAAPSGGPGTAATGVAAAPNVTDRPSPPAGVAAKVAARGIDSLSAKERAAWQAYLAETAAVVANNATDFRSALDAAIAAIIAKNVADLQAAYAPDENVSTEYATSLANAYPQIESGAPQTTVGIFAVGKATVYFGYAVVRWQDGGIVSEHTIAIPMRFIGDRWYLTSIGSGTGGLTTVQSVRIQD